MIAIKMRVIAVKVSEADDAWAHVMFQGGYHLPIRIEQAALIRVGMTVQITIEESQ